MPLRSVGQSGADGVVVVDVAVVVDIAVVVDVVRVVVVVDAAIVVAVVATTGRKPTPRKRQATYNRAAKPYRVIGKLSRIL